MTIPIETNQKDKNNENFLKLKGFIQEIELQFSLGKSELIDEFEIQKKNLKTFINEQKGNINLAEKTNEIKGFFEELELQLALGKAENKEIFEAQKDKITQKISAIEEIINLYEKKLEHKEESFFQSFVAKAYKLKAVMEILKSEFHLEKSDLKDKTDERKKDIADKLQIIKLEIENDFNIIKSSVKSIFNSFFTGLKHDSPIIATHKIDRSEAEMEKQRNSVEERNAKHQEIINAKKDIKHV